MAKSAQWASRTTTNLLSITRRTAWRRVTRASMRRVILPCLYVIFAGALVLPVPAQTGEKAGMGGAEKSVEATRYFPRKRPEPAWPAGKAPEFVVTRNLGTFFDPLDQAGSHERLEQLLAELDYSPERDVWIDFGNFSAPWLQELDRKKSSDSKSEIHQSAGFGLLPVMRELGCRAAVLAEQEMLLDPNRYRWNDVETGYFVSNLKITKPGAPLGAPRPVEVDAFGLKIGAIANPVNVLPIQSAEATFQQIELPDYDQYNNEWFDPTINQIANFENVEQGFISNPSQVLAYVVHDKITKFSDFRTGPTGVRYVLQDGTFTPLKSSLAPEADYPWNLKNSGVAWEYDSEISPTLVLVPFENFRMFDLRTFSPGELAPLDPKIPGSSNAGSGITTEPSGELHIAHYALRVWGDTPTALLLRIAPVDSRPEDKRGVIIHRIWSGQFRVGTEEQFHIGALPFSQTESYRLFGETIRRETFIRKLESEYPALIPHLAPIEAVMRRMDQIADEYKNEQD